MSERRTVKGQKRCAIWLSVPIGIWVMVQGLTACVTRMPAAPERGRSIHAPDPLPPEVWPARYVDPVVEYTREIDLAFLPGTGKPSSYRDSKEAEMLLRANERGYLAGLFICRGAYRNGIVYQYGFDQGMETYRVLVNALPPEEFDQLFHSCEAAEDETAALGRWTFKLPKTQKPARGLIVHQISLAGAPYEAPVIDALRLRGWAVLSAIPDGFTFEIWEGDEARPSRLVGPARFAQRFDHYAADSAYAVESMLAYFAEFRPDVPRDPLVFLGFSLGALTVPTVAARLDSGVDAAVIVGGGANAGRILVDGDLTGPSRRYLRQKLGSGVAKRLRTYPQQHLEHARLDPYHTAPYLIDTPVLVLQAAFDRIVPAATGDVLYERLGQPDRWTYSLGHFGLFWWLPTQAEAIADWIDRAVGQAVE